MDNLTHSLVAVALSRAGLQRVMPNATLLLIISANIPDIDLLSLAGGQLTDLQVHRGYTHALIAIPFLAIISALLTTVIAEERISLLKGFFVGCIGVTSHLLLDWTSSFGIRPFLPFSSRWFYLDVNGFYDGIILAVMALAFIWPWFVDLVSSEIGRNTKHRGQGSAILVLLFLLIYEGGRFSLHQRALNQLSSRLYDGQVPVAVSALAEPNDPLHWTGIIETVDAFRVVRTGTLDINQATDARIYRKPPRSAAYLGAMKTQPFAYMAYFSRFPAWDIEPGRVNAGVGLRMDLTDLRFGIPGSGDFHASALADASGHILGTAFGFSTLEMDQLFNQ